MKKVIGGLRYDTEGRGVVMVGSFSRLNGDLRDFEEALYKTPSGRYFWAGEGGPMSAYGVPCGGNSWVGGSAIVPCTVQDAIEWCERTQPGDSWLIYFDPEVVQDA